MILGTRRRKAEKLFAEIDLLSRENREHRDPGVERRILELRHQAGSLLIDNPEERHLSAEEALAPAVGERGLPEIEPASLDAGTLRAAIGGHGCLLVPALATRQEAASLAAGIDGALAARASAGANGGGGEGLYEEFEPEARFESPDREWISETGGVLTGDSPRLMCEVLELFARTGLTAVIGEYLGERPAVSLQKSTLRKASPGTPGAWHQDGHFLGQVGAMNVWLSLSECGETAPGLDLIPRHLEDFVPTGTEGTFLPDQVSDAVALEAAGEGGILRPVFEPGDVLLFDEMFLHQTGSDPSMQDDRYAIESWFFAPSRWPGSYVPFAV